MFLATDVSGIAAFILSVLGQTSLHRDNISGRIDVLLSVDAVGSILVTCVVGGGAIEEKANENVRQSQSHILFS